LEEEQGRMEGVAVVSPSVTPQGGKDDGVNLLHTWGFEKESTTTFFSLYRCFVGV